jgi:putative transposase
MSRPLRIEIKNAWYHVMNRGRRHEEVFTGKEDYLRFMQLLQETIEMWNLRVSAFCLMPNHYHLLIQTPDGNVSRCMRHIDGVYAQRFNRSHGHDGSLFRGRFKSILVDERSYLLEVLRYIHRNPLKAGLSKTLEQYPWTSHKGYISKAKNWNWLHKKHVLSKLTRTQNLQLEFYRAFAIKKAIKILRKFLKERNGRLSWVPGTSLKRLKRNIPGIKPMMRFRNQKY